MATWHPPAWVAVVGPDVHYDDVRVVDGAANQHSGVTGRGSGEAEHDPLFGRHDAAGVGAAVPGAPQQPALGLGDSLAEAELAERALTGRAPQGVERVFGEE